MARIVRRTLTGPKAFVVDGKEQWLCQCGLSKSQPFCDGSHKLTLGEELGKLYWYDEEGRRHDAPGAYPEIRSF